ncbi:hypothetical protein ACFZAD_00305 [Streptomyces iakyrus]|uniref:hypothetical protein n=1 Tax=Streptomyces iakyrus TaxID=68219 RepID=UPI0036E3AD34
MGREVAVAAGHGTFRRRLSDRTLWIVRVRGGAEHFLAHPASAADRIETGTVVMVVEYLPPRTVYVTAAYDSCEAEAIKARAAALNGQVQKVPVDDK